MLDPRIYRAAFLPVLVVVLVVAFSLGDRPRPITTTLAPDAFDASRAFATLQQLTTAFPRRRPGSDDDLRLADRVAQGLQALGPGTVQRYASRGQTIDGARDLDTIVATRPGRPGPGIVLVAHRDSAGSPAEAELSGTAALLELARVAGLGRLNRSITFVSTSGGSGGLAGARAALAHLPGPVDAVLVLGDLAGRQVRKPFVVPWSNSTGIAPLRLRRTVEAAVRAETGQDAGGPHVGAQWARLAFGVTTGEQGEFGRAGLGAVELSASGERTPDPGASVAEGRLRSFGKAALRTVLALDEGPDIASGPRAELVTKRKVLPEWAVRLLVGSLLLPVWLATIDGLARARRRRAPVAAGLRWALATALPFALLAAAALLLGVAGLLPARPPAPVPPGAVPVDGAAAGALVALGLIFALGWLAVRPLAIRASGAREREDRGSRHAPPPARGAPTDAGAIVLRAEREVVGRAAGMTVVLALVTFVAWLVNPFAAALVILPAHAWALAGAPGMRLPRPVALLFVLLALAPLALEAHVLGSALGYGVGSGSFALVLMIAGGHVGVAAWLGWSLTAGCGVSAALLALRAPAGGAEAVAAVSSRGPGTYAGPGSLGGTESALRR